jgi:hypothetical protein
MRPKIVLLVLLAGLAGITGIVLLKRPASPPPVPATVQEVQAVAPPAAPAIKTEAVAAPVTPAPAPVAVTPVATNPAPVLPVVDTVATNAQHEAAVQAKIDKLQDLQANDDPASLKAILTELGDPDKEVRAVAIEATIQFGDRSAIPVLKDLAATTTDSGEKKALLDAVEFMSLPTMTEVHAARLQSQQ